VTLFLRPLRPYRNQAIMPWVECYKHGPLALLSVSVFRIAKEEGMIFPIRIYRTPFVKITGKKDYLRLKSRSNEDEIWQSTIVRGTFQTLDEQNKAGTYITPTYITGSLLASRS
jgi:hypothetical protein